MQDRKTYAKGVTNVTADAKAKIGMPVVDGECTVESEATLAYFAGEIPESGSMLVTLEVNGTVIAYRELYTFDSDEGYIHVGDYYIANDSGSVAVETMEGGDVVRLKVEPIVIEVNDVFRAAVNETAPQTPNELPAVTDADDGKVLTANSGVWGASFLDGSGRKLQISATYSDGAYTTNTQITPDEYYRAVTSGYTCELWIGSVTYKLHLLMDEYNDFAFYKATLQDASNVLVQINGFDQEYLTISIYPYDNRFIVTLTPTAADYSGTMDKTIAEIDAAYKAGRQVVFRIMTGGTTYYDGHVTFIDKGIGDYPAYTAYVLDTVQNVQVVAYTPPTDDGTNQTYSTKVYTLTPAT